MYSVNEVQKMIDCFMGEYQFPFQFGKKGNSHHDNVLDIKTIDDPMKGPLVMLKTGNYVDIPVGGWYQTMFNPVNIYITPERFEKLCNNTDSDFEFTNVEKKPKIDPKEWVIGPII